MKKQLSQIREFFWPLLEPKGKGLEEQGPKAVIEITDECLELAYVLQMKKLDNEEDRRKGIETKAALLLSSISVASSLVVAANSLGTSSNNNNIAIRCSVFISFILSVYSIRAIWFSVRALERRGFHVLGFRDINIPGTKVEYQKRLITKIEGYVYANQIIVNDKLDFLTMAQEYYKRAIVIICLYAFTICMYCFVFPNGSIYSNSLQQTKKTGLLLQLKDTTGSDKKILLVLSRNQIH